MDNVENKKTFNNKQVLSLLGAAIFSTFSLTSIYNKFVFNDEEIQLNKQTIDVNHSSVNDRLDKKTKRNQDRITELETEIKNLKEPNSDKQ